MCICVCVWGGCGCKCVCVHVPWPECGGQRAASEVTSHAFHLVCGSVGQAAGPPASRHSPVLLLTSALERWACRRVLPCLDLYGWESKLSFSPLCPPLVTWVAAELGTALASSPQGSPAVISFIYLLLKDKVSLCSPVLLWLAWNLLSSAWFCLWSAETKGCVPHSLIPRFLNAWLLF